MDLSHLSDADLLKLYHATPASPPQGPAAAAPSPAPAAGLDLTKMSDADLMALHRSMSESDAAASAGDQPSTLAAIGRGLTQGATLGFGDELAGALGGAASWARGEGFQSGYERSRDETRARDLRAEQAHPWATTGGKLAGGIVATAPMIAAAPRRSGPRRGWGSRLDSWAAQVRALLSAASKASARAKAPRRTRA